MEDSLATCQQPNGGIATGYTRSLSTVGYEENTETTALARALSFMLMIVSVLGFGDLCFFGADSVPDYFVSKRFEKLGCV
jgi:hypothetical protein